MREHKFRAWNKDLNHMIQDSPISMSGIMRDKVRKATTQNGDLIGKEYVIMQYTGLKDKNGKEVYEGDIVRVLREDSFKPYISEVYFAGGCFGTGWRNPIEGRVTFVYLHYWDNELLGNIYENPELLKGE